MPRIMTDEEFYGPSKPKAPAPPPAPSGSPTLPGKPLSSYTYGPPSQLPPLPDLTKPTKPQGKVRFDELMKSAPVGFVAASHDWDQWVLSIRPDPSDPEFSGLLAHEQYGAMRREKERGIEAKMPVTEDEETRLGLAAGKSAQGFAQQKNEERLAEEAERQVQKGAQTARETRAGKRKTTYRRNVIIDPSGREVSGPGVPAQPSSQSELMAPPGQTPDELGDVRDGEHVWIGSATQTMGDTIQDQTTYMTVDDAETLPYQWSPQDIAMIQKAFGMPVTGVLDKKIISLWGGIVDLAAGYTAAGRNISPYQLLQMAANAEQAKRRASGRGGGGGGGGGGRAGYNRSEVRAFFNAVMIDEVGREATEQESAAFFAAFSGAGDVDPQQFAIDWIRSQMGGEAGAYSAVNYYEAMLQVLGSTFGGG